MNAVYLDSSAIVKRYVDEMGSNWLKAFIANNDQTLLFTSRMTIVEVTSAFARRKRERSLSQQDFDALESAFRSDCQSAYHIIPPTTEIINRACELVSHHPLRAYDATHLASAMSAHEFLSLEGIASMAFLSADDRLNSAAAIEGLLTDNPNQYP
ncbi:MAG: type II toxin-antitoxin system VapC family toxin [Anaerolineae bacterium]|nr:type II toxin-antitoxin system VapC family toxin [Anaerolineae bacterium]MCB0255535.1 type II toxin-antitoxin system VapC family toxin [Anaerolineae bacterium]